MMKFKQYFEAQHDEGPFAGLWNDLQHLAKISEKRNGFSGRIEFRKQYPEDDAWFTPSHLIMNQWGNGDFVPTVERLLQKWGFTDSVQEVGDGANVRVFRINLTHNSGAPVDRLAVNQNRRRNPTSPNDDVSSARWQWIGRKRRKSDPNADLYSDFMFDRSIVARWSELLPKLDSVIGALDYESQRIVRSLSSASLRSLGTPAFYTDIQILADALEDANQPDLAGEVRRLMQPL